jgi:glycosyltransferase involved in cell wall biosynthesis
MTPHYLVADAIAALNLLLATGWLVKAIGAIRGVPTLPDLTLRAMPLPDLDATQGPDVTVVVPACNEEQAIEATLSSLLGSAGVRLEIIAIDDRSTDRTGSRMDRVAAQALPAGSPHTLEVIHNRDLPEGWIGKPHALALGADRARAPWLLFSDGDMQFDPRAIALGLGFAQADRADHLVLAYTLDLKSVAEAAVMGAFGALSLWNFRPWRVADHRARDFFGAGGFSLVRREVYEQLGGFRAVRMEVVEDLRLALEIKRAGYRQRFVLGPGLARVRWIEGALGLVAVLEKNGFAGLRYRTGLALLAFFGLAVQIALPLAAMALGGWPAVAGLLVYATIALAYQANRPISQASPWLAVLFAPATAILLFALIRSTVLALTRDGVEWRGTRYPLKELRRNAGRSWR